MGSFCSGLASLDAAFAFGGFAFAKDAKISDFSRLRVAVFAFVSVADCDVSFCDDVLFWRLFVLSGIGSFAVDFDAVGTDAPGLGTAGGGTLRPTRLCEKD
jgi:hypothetical protein